MNVLLDTHAVLWTYMDPTRLSTDAKQHILDPSVNKFVSMASLWETAIKLSIGKLTTIDDFDTFVSEAVIENDFEILHIAPSHASETIRLPWVHRDPFDRMLAAQARVENMSLVSSDAVMDQYGVTRIW